MKKYIFVLVIILSNSALGSTCNVNTSRSKSPWHYTNPNTACGIEFSMPGLPDFSLDWELPDINICNAVRDFADDLIGDEYDDLIDIPSEREGGGVQVPGGGTLPPGVELPREICEEMPRLCSEDGVNPKLNTLPSKSSQDNENQYDEVFCHPNNPQDPRNHASCQYRKISIDSSLKPQNQKSSQQTSNQSNKRKENKTSQSYWDKRYNKNKGGNE